MILRDPCSCRILVSRGGVYFPTRKDREGWARLTTFHSTAFLTTCTVNFSRGILENALPRGLARCPHSSLGESVNRSVWDSTSVSWGGKYLSATEQSRVSLQPVAEEPAKRGRANTTNGFYYTGTERNRSHDGRTRSPRNVHGGDCPRNPQSFPCSSRPSRWEKRL